MAKKSTKRGASSKKVKKVAKRTRISVELTSAQMQSIIEQWGNASRPAEITFAVRGSDRAEFKVAAYSYVDTTCCAKR
jgi:hypothetical protein